MATPNPSQPPTRRAVVSSFIFKFPDEGQKKPQIALFRRSDKVRTYRHHLAPISGSIDPNESPLEAAWREISEETSLNSISLSHWRTGKPFSFTDPSVNREWTIHPFAFHLKGTSEGGLGEKAIKTDWEHEGWQWFDLDSIVDNEEFGGVPRLHESLRRIWFEGEMNERTAEVLAAGLGRLQTDHQSGSQELTAVALTVFRDIVQTRGGIDDEWWTMVRMAAWHLGNNGRESMGTSITNALISILGDIDEIRQQQTNEEAKWGRILGAIDQRLSKRKCQAKKITDALVSYLQSNCSSSDNQQEKNRITIMTVSASSTIQDSILDAFGALENVKALEIRVLESRPLYEGVTIASSLYSQFKSRFPASSQNKTLEIRVYTDASAAIAATDVDFLLLGTDRISITKGISNKTGSLPAILSAKHAQPSVKVIVLSDLEKIGLNGEESHSLQEENDPMEVVNGWNSEGVKGLPVLEDGLNASKANDSNARVEVKNVYFEWVPLALVDALVCEQGVLDKDSIRDQSRRLGGEMNRYFGEL